MDDNNNRKKGYVRVSGWYIIDVKFPDMANKLDVAIIDTIANCGAALPHATSPEEAMAVLDILLRDAWELYLREWERANA